MEIGAVLGVSFRAIRAALAYYGDHPEKMRALGAKRCAEGVTMMETNSRLNDAPAETLWRDM